MVNTRESVPRGVRNNNPGNLVRNVANHWLGELPFDPSIESRFCRFATPQYGIRALARTLITYQCKYGLSTVPEIIARWAPQTENDTKAYIRQVQNYTGFLDQELRLEDFGVLSTIVRAILIQENGALFYVQSVIDDGVRSALS